MKNKKPNPPHAQIITADKKGPLPLDHFDDANRHCSGSSGYLGLCLKCLGSKFITTAAIGGNEWVCPRCLGSGRENSKDDS